MQDSILRKEILQQPATIDKLLKSEKKNIQRIATDVKGRFRYIIIAARGSSDNAARYAQYLFGVENKIAVALATPSLFTIYQRPPDLSDALVIGISQSGQSPDIVSVMKEAHKQNCATIAITNDVNSPLAVISKFTIPLHTGKEMAIAATKSYTSSLAVLAMLSCFLANNIKRYSELSFIPELMNIAISKSNERIEYIQRYRYMENCFVIGRGFNYATAFEIALKIKELTGIATIPYSSADFLHGPIAAIHKGFPVILISPFGAMNQDIIALQKRLIELGAEIISISNIKNVVKKSNLVFILPDQVPEWISPIVAVVPGQIFALQLSLESGLNPDHPKGLTKITKTL